MADAVASGVLELYRRLPDEVRRCLRPLNLLDEGASFLSAPARAVATTGTEMVRRLLQLRQARYVIRRLEGRDAQGGRPLVCLLALDDPSARYWSRTLFATPPAERTMGEVGALGVRQAAERLAPLADLSLWQLPWPLSRLAGGQPLVPSSVPLWLDTGRPFEAIVTGGRSGRSSRKDDARRVRRLGLSVRLGACARDLERFRCELYEPYGAQRFGDLFMRVPRHVFRHASRAGWLLMLEDRRRTVAGALLERWGRDVRILAFGVETDGPLATGLLLEACYFHAIRFAVDAGVPRLSLGTVRPVLTDGVLRYKRKWGGVLGAPHTWEAFLLRYRNTAAVRGALGATPLILDRGRRGLAGLMGAGSPDVSAQLAGLDTPGLSEIVCLTAAAGPVDARPASLVPTPAVWPPEAAVNASAALAPEALPVRHLLGRPPAADAELAPRPAHGD
ncbi:MAG TPA: hypothetical protein VEM57_01160 [Candidatus Binatus sp.]|nr:hypothetical protein [Candidatus Binatus sp.]